MLVFKVIVTFSLALILYTILPLPFKTSLDMLYERDSNREKGIYVLDDPKKEESLMAYEQKLMKVNKIYLFGLAFLSCLLVSMF